MNPRVREMWSQCVIKHTRTPMNWQNVADEFAELIVQECLGVVESSIYGPHGEYDYSYSDADAAADSRAQSIHDDIKYRFGVEP